jgi:acyl carrier protein
MATILERLTKIIAEQLGSDEESIVPSASFAYDLNADPSDLAELITAIEEEFSTPRQKVELSDEDMKKINTVQDIIDCLRDYVPGD